MSKSKDGQTNKPQPKLEQIHPADLIPYARNAKKHDPEQVAKIAGSIREFGFNNPVLIDQSNGIIAGHGRIMAAIKLGLESVPVIRLSHLTETQRRAYILADNKLAELGGGWDEEMLRVELDAIKESDLDHLLTGFSEEEFKEVVEEIDEDIDEDDGANIKHYSSSIYQFNEDVVFDSSNWLGLPNLRKDMLFETIPDDTWAGQKGCDGQFEKLWVTLHGANAPVPGMRCLKAFYVDDHRFESIWNDAVSAIEKFKQQGFEGFFEPDFSTWTEMPMIVQFWNLYRSRWCARYWQEAGFKIIPLLNWPSKVIYESAAEFYPKEIKLASIQVRTLHKNIKNDLKGLQRICETIEVESLLVYGGCDNQDAIEVLTKMIPQTKMIAFPSFTQRARETRLSK